MDKQLIGQKGEDAACEYLSKKGYLIESRNFRKTYGEIDIVAMDRDGCRVFVEVKTRKNKNFGYASEFVDYKKQDRVRRTAFSYCGGECYMRFDIVEVYYKVVNDTMVVTEIEHIEDAF